jgi:2-keto-4-pentenoate hydratase/2-oxohepta-3-ene-1,7-dioic acid hydratase in catechol pathway
VSCLHKGIHRNQRSLFHKIPEVLAFLSRYMTLEPGDMSMGTALKRSAQARAPCGTSSSTAAARSARISGLGELTNPVSLR